MELKPAVDVVGGGPNGGDRYSSTLRSRATRRAPPCSNYLSDRDAVAIDVVLGAAVEPLTTVLTCGTIDPGRPRTSCG